MPHGPLRHGVASQPGVLEAACQLRAREVESFALVRAHSFTDLTESNYWHRGRLKFPGDLEQLLRRLAEGVAVERPSLRARRLGPAGHRATR